MDFSIVYHYWNNWVHDPIRDVANPVILSIALVRRFYPEVPIYVADISDVKLDWKDYPNYLNFQVNQNHSALPLKFDSKYNLSYNSWKYCSSVFDVLKFDVKTPVTMFCDSDLFFLRKLNQLDYYQGGLRCLPDLVGFYYYDDSKRTKEFFQEWKRNILKGIVSWNFRKEVVSHYRLKNLYTQETVYSYLYQKPEWKDVIKTLSFKEHCIHLNYNCNDVDLFHFTGGLFGQRRGVCGYLIKEYRKSLLEVLGRDRYDYVFGNISPEFESIEGRIRFNQRSILTRRNVNYPLDKSLDKNFLRLNSCI